MENKSSETRTLDVFTYVEYQSEWHVWHDTLNFQYAQYIVDCDVRDGFLSHAVSTNLPERPEEFEFRDQSRHTFLTLIGAPVTGFDTDREAFLGPYRTYQIHSSSSRASAPGVVPTGTTPAEPSPPDSARAWRGP